MLLRLLPLFAMATSCRRLHQVCWEPGTPANHSSCCAGLHCNGSLHEASSRCTAGTGVCRGSGQSCTVAGSGGGINPTDFATNWVSTCCEGLQCRLGSSPSDWICTSSTPPPAGPANEVIIRGPKKLPASLPILSRATLKGISGAYKPWLMEHTQTETILMAYRSMPSKALAFQRSTDYGASWSTPETRGDLAGDGEWSLHALKSGVVLLADGGGRMYRSTDGAVTFSNVSGQPAAPAGQPFKFSCTDECGSWSVVEVGAADQHAGLPSGVYFFTDRTMWHSTTEGETWRPVSRANCLSGHMPRGNEFYSQSQLYRRRDGTFLHSARMNTAPCDGWAGEQLWKSNDTAAEHWNCMTQAAGGFCNPLQHGHSLLGGTTPCFHQADEPIQCAAEHFPNWLKPGNHYSHWLRLHDDRLLLSKSGLGEMLH